MLSIKTLIFNGSPHKSGDTAALLRRVTALLRGDSRLQTYFCARHFRGEKPIARPKKGAVLLVGGEDGRAEKAYETACGLLRHMNAVDIFPAVCSHRTNRIPAAADEAALADAEKIAGFFNAAEA